MLPGWRGDPVEEDVAQRDDGEVMLVEPLQVGAKLVDRAHPVARFAGIGGEDVVFQDENLTDLVRLRRRRRRARHRRRLTGGGQIGGSGRVVDATRRADGGYHEGNDGGDGVERADGGAPSGAARLTP
jgi:hypothetical protein